MLPQSPFNNPPLSVFLKGWWSCRVRKRLHLFWWKIKLQRHHHLIYVVEPQVEKKRGGKKKLKLKETKVLWGLMNWGQKPQKVMCESLSNGFVHVKLVQGCGGLKSGVRLHLQDAEFFPLRSKRDSLVSRCSTKTHGEETRPSSVIMRGQIQTHIFNTVRTQSSKNSTGVMCS